MPAQMRINLEVDDKGSIVVKQFSSTAVSSIDRLKTRLSSMGSFTSTLKSRFQSLGRGIGSVFGGVIKQLTSLKGLMAGALAGYGLKNLSQSFIDAASTAEGYQVRLNTLLGSVNAGNQLFEDMAKFAGSVPFEYREIMGAATQLAGVMRGGVEEINKWMPMIADLAAVSGMGIQETTGQVIRMYSAGAASADMFRERGILAMMGFKAGVSYTAEETRKMMFEAWDASGSKFKGVTEDLAKTWKGLTSMLADKWEIFRKAVMDAGLMDFLKDRLQLILNMIDKFKDTGGFDSLARSISDYLVDALTVVNNKFWDLVDTWAEVKAVLEKGGNVFDLVGGFIKKITDGISPLTSKISGLGSTIKKLMNDIGPLIKFLKWLATGAGQLAAKTAQVAGGLYGRWESGQALFDFTRDQAPLTGERTDAFATEPKKSYATGTGLRGLPRTGLFMGHKGEIVKSPGESRAERRGKSGNVYNVTIAPQIMTGDRASIARAWNEFENYKRSVGK